MTHYTHHASKLKIFKSLNNATHHLKFDFYVPKFSKNIGTFPEYGIKNMYYAIIQKC